MSSTTWTTRAVASSAATARRTLWRAVEAQHVASTMPLVDSIEEQHILERLLDDTKPPVPMAAARLHWLLFTPFRYPPPPGGSRFRGPNDPGVFYGADEIRTACAELGYWRWRHLSDSPALDAMPTKPQTVFKVRIATQTVDLREKPFARDRLHWTEPQDYSTCQRFARTARDAGVGAIRYESVRDPKHGAGCAVLSPIAFAPSVPLEQQTWMLSVARDRVVWQRTHALRVEEHEFAAKAWQAVHSPKAAASGGPRHCGP
ncbi:MAG: RES family NAD+ phosphorylase [Betaproteobacteria bacterium]